jgi:hypothetical protein
MRRREFLSATAMLMGGGMLARAGEAPATPRGWFDRRHRQLFLDDLGIAATRNVVRTLNPPARHPENPVLVPDTPWESRCQVYGTALYDEELQRFRLWYLTTPPERDNRPLDVGGHLRAPHTTLAAYAESEDGVHFVKPALGQLPFDGDAANNLLALGVNNCEGVSVLHRPDHWNPRQRFAAAYWDHGSGGFTMRDGRPYCEPGPADGLCVAFSRDGLHWAPYSGNPVLARYCDTNQNLLYDPAIGRYVVFSRLGFGRRLAQSESEDCLQWTEPELVLECDEADGPAAQVYGAGVDLYEGLYLAMVWVYHEGTDGTIDTQLAVSRDGFAWMRVAERATWLALGDPDGWEGGMVRPCERVIVRGDTLYIYYCGVHGAHSGPVVGNVTERKHPCSIGLLTQRRDGFVSMDAGDAWGELLTQPFEMPVGRLKLNVDAAGGEVYVALCDPHGRVVSGFAESRAIREDAGAAEVTWPARSTYEVAGREVSLRFRMRGAKLYAYWFA